MNVCVAGIILLAGMTFYISCSPFTRPCREPTKSNSLKTSAKLCVTLRVVSGLRRNIWTPWRGALVEGQRHLRDLECAALDCLVRFCLAAGANGHIGDEILKLQGRRQLRKPEWPSERERANHKTALQNGQIAPLTAPCRWPTRSSRSLGKRGGS